MIVALASPRVASSLDEGLEKVRRFIAEASARGAQIVCFPEAYLPGLRGQEFAVPPFDEADQERALCGPWRNGRGSTGSPRSRVSSGSRRRAGRSPRTLSTRRAGVQGFQTKNQVDPTEDPHYVPGDTRSLFEIDGVKFGVTICHEGWRYPETVRWAAVRGAKIVFHPQYTGSDRSGVVLTQWGAADGPYYEKAMMMRSRENTIYFASVNYALRFQESATSLIAPSGECQAHLPYGEEGLLVQEIDVTKATGLLAMRYAPERYREAQPA